MQLCVRPPMHKELLPLSFFSLIIPAKLAVRPATSLQSNGTSRYERHSGKRNWDEDQKKRIPQFRGPGDEFHGSIQVQATEETIPEIRSIPFRLSTSYLD